MIKITKIRRLHLSFSILAQCDYIGNTPYTHPNIKISKMAVFDPTSHKARLHLVVEEETYQMRCSTNTLLV